VPPPIPGFLSLLAKSGAPSPPALPVREGKKEGKSEYKPVPLAKIYKLFSIYTALRGAWDPSISQLEEALKKHGAKAVSVEGKTCYTIEFQGGSRSLSAEKRKVRQALEDQGLEVLWEVPLPGEETFTSTFAFIRNGWLRRSLYVVDIDSRSVFEYSKLGHSADAYAVSQDRDRRRAIAAKKVAYYLRIDAESVQDDAFLKSFLARGLATSNWSCMTLAKPEKYTWL